ncbi:MAG: DNA repair protein RecN [Muribaculaceae bacterium]|nr:DNA repair protein RecN [Muribaculaceae bacterium]
MIKSLRISNYALISQIEIELCRGLNIITGETGAGKSVMLGALGLLLGGRADMRVVRDSSRKSVIEAVADISDAAGIDAVFEENGLDKAADSMCILRRELLPGGRSRAFVNDTPVTLQVLKAVSLRLIDIHSQHQNLLLADSAYQLSVVDSLADNAELRARYSEAYAAYRRALKAYTDMRDLLLRSASDAEYLKFQLEQLDEMHLEPGEQATLEQERDMMANATSIKQHLQGALGPLADDTVNAISALAEAAVHCRALGDMLEDAEALAARLDSARIEVQDVAENLSELDSRVQADPALLDAIEERLGKLYSLEVKHHVDTVEQLIELRDSLRAKLAALDGGEDSLAALELAARKAKKEAMLLARELSDTRRAAAQDFAEQLTLRAMPLGMKNLRCEVAFNAGRLTPTGLDLVEFRFAFNKNQTPLPIGGTASGGEISRLMLTVKSIIAERMQLPTIIFDEVDTGVSGDVAARMADMMLGLAGRLQVVAITHLPAVAARGSAHFRVYKQDTDSSTETHIARLDAVGREREIATMLSGRPDDPTALAAARSLLNNNNSLALQ